MNRILTAFLVFLIGYNVSHSQKASATRDSYDWKEIELKLNEFNMYDDYEESVFREKVGTHYTSYQPGTPSEALEFGKVFRYRYNECSVSIIYDSVYHLNFEDSTLAINNLRVGDHLDDVKRIFPIGKIVEENEEKSYDVQIDEGVLAFYLNNDNVVTRITWNYPL